MEHNDLYILLNSSQDNLIDELLNADLALKPYLEESFETHNLNEVDSEFLLYYVGIYYFEIGKSNNVISIFDYTIKKYFSKSEEYVLHHFSALNYIGLSQHTLGKFDDALVTFNQAEPLLNNYSSEEQGFTKKELQLKLSNNRIDALLEKGESSKAILLYNKNLKKLDAKNSNEYAPVLQTLLGRANAFRNTGQFSNAIDDYSEAKVLAKRLQNYQSQARAYHGLGNVYGELDELRLSVLNYYKALCFYKKAEDYIGIIDGYIHLGSGLHTLGLEDVLAHPDYQLNKRNIAYLKKAMQYYLKALNEAGGDDIINKLDVQLKIASLLTDLKKYSEAEKIYLQVQLSDIYQHNYWLQHQTLLGLVNIYDYTNKKKEAIDLLHKIKVFTRKYNRPEDESQCNALTGLIFKNEGQLIEAKQYFSLAINSLETLGINLKEENIKLSYYGKKVDTYREMIHACILDADYQTAFHFLEKSKTKALRDVLSNSLSQKSDDQINAEYKALTFEEVLEQL